ncbi:hypothetical protein [Amycolatopsis panacis]|nr:hypothetical protein [Amycolatopsis panacis]
MQNLRAAQPEAVVRPWQDTGGGLSFTVFDVRNHTLMGFVS